MSFISRLFKPRGDDREPVRPLWHRTVELARDPRWYRDGGVADTVAGRFDAITLVLCGVLLRMEREPALVPPSVLLTELFVDDMDGQLRQSGVGDLVVGKHIGKLVSSLGGRLGALREALAESGDAALVAAIERNVSLRENGNPAVIAALLRGLAKSLDAAAAEDILAARIGLP
ncbi:MAG TPA: ubiquinol-cytochrome C chaperone family protein [Novosphingobium sp.]|nr:ubiquinol-cytochrome C chaperone family protein [Novosphingobium sp.]